MPAGKMSFFVLYWYDLLRCHKQINIPLKKMDLEHAIASYQDRDFYTVGVFLVSEAECRVRRRHVVDPKKRLVDIVTTCMKG